MSDFLGPVFVVGLPRSGTKLLRDLLNRNPKVSIPEAETHFIPYFIRKYGSPAPLADPRVFESFWKELNDSTFFQNMCPSGSCLEAVEFAASVDLHNWGSIFEGILRAFGPRRTSPDVIFGDKTPDYLRSMDFLKAHFPAAKFVHIIRDPRDVCLSARGAWNHHPYSVAHRWQGTLAKHREAGRWLGDYVEIRYEDLVSSSEAVLRTVCRLLDVEFVAEMLTLSRPAESVGEAKGESRIVTDNTKKFWKGFSRDEIRRIEEITFDQMHSLGYEVHLADESRPLNGISYTLLRGRDAVSFVESKAEELGWAGALKYSLRQRKNSVRRE